MSKYLLFCILFTLPVNVSEPQNALPANEVKEAIELANEVVITPTVAILPQIDPILERIAYCESTGLQFDPKTGKTLRGRTNRNDVGKYQINVLYHEKSAKNMGFDLYTLEGNTAYAEYLYRTQGTKPWNASRKCWSKYT